MSQNHRKPSGGPRVEEGFPLWRNHSAPRRNPLLEFRAGKMFVRGNMVYPDTRKGMVFIYQDDGGVMHFCWMDRSRGVIEDDIHTMPSDCSYKRIEKCTTGRVYMLKMRSSKRTLFFWMQEPSTANDLQICNRVNSLLNFPPPRMMFPEQIFSNELQFILNQLNSEQLHALYNGDDIVWVDTRNQPPEVGQEQTNTPAPPAPFVNLGEVVNEESIKAISINKGLMKRLEGKLPPIEGTQKDNLEDTVKSFAFKHAIEDFSMALRQGTSGQILRELNVNAAAVEAADRGDVDSFVKALQGGAMATPHTRGGPSSGPGNSGSRGGKSKDPSPASNKRNSEGNRKESVQKEETKGNNKQTNGGTRKRNYDAVSRGTSKVNSAQQTEPIMITSLVQSVGAEMKVSRKLQQFNVHSNEKSENTDPVRIGEYVSKGFENTNSEWPTTSSVISKPGGSHEQGYEQQVTVKRQHALPETSMNTKTDAGIEFFDEICATQQPKNDKIELVNDHEMENPLKRRCEDVEENGANSQKKIKFIENAVCSEVRPIEDGTNDTEENLAINEFNIKSDSKPQIDGDQTKLPENEISTFEIGNLQSKSNVRSIEEMQQFTDGNERTVTKVEGEQQTEPVRIKTVTSSGAELKLTTKRASARGQRMDGSMERSQNTDPVLIEEKHKRHSKPKEPKQE